MYFMRRSENRVNEKPKLTQCGETQKRAKTLLLLSLDCSHSFAALHFRDAQQLGKWVSACNRGTYACSIRLISPPTKATFRATDRGGFSSSRPASEPVAD